MRPGKFAIGASPQRSERPALDDRWVDPTDPERRPIVFSNRPFAFPELDPATTVFARPRSPGTEWAAPAETETSLWQKRRRARTTPDRAPLGTRRPKRYDAK